MSYDCTELLTVGINKNKPQNIEFAAFPNPATDKLTIKCNALKNEKVQVQVYDANARLAGAFSANFATAAMDIDMRSYKPGLYYIQITDATGQKSIRAKVMKR